MFDKLESIETRYEEENEDESESSDVISIKTRKRVG